LNFAQATGVPHPSRLKAEHLNQQGHKLPEAFNIVDQIIGSQAPGAGLPAQLPHTVSPLVNQRWYSAVMGSNPSRQIGEDHPVDSVDLHEVTAFCERLSWILVRPIRLPTWQELEGDPLESSPTGISREWTSSTSTEGTHAIFEHHEGLSLNETRYHPPTERSRSHTFRVVW